MSKGLKYAHEHGAPWEFPICEEAAEHGQLNCLSYAIEHGCPWNREDCLQRARENNHPEIVEYIQTH